MNKIYRYGKLVLFLALVATLLCVCLGAMAVEDCGDGNHKPTREQVMPTCTEEGYEREYCSVCGREFGIRKISALDHQEGEPTVVSRIEPTCVSIGQEIKVTKCVRCGKEMSRTISEIKALGHDPEERKDPDATCTSTGLLRTVCKRCSFELGSQIIPMKAHVPGDWKVTKEPTCTETGVQTQKCALCATVLDTKTIAAKGHNWDNWKVTKEATCTAAGEQSHVCKNDSSHVETMPYGQALGHNYGAWATTKDATCEASGTREHKCSRCGDTQTEVIPALGHKWDAGSVTTPPTCEGTGEKLYTCQNDSTHTQKETIPALGHKWNEGTVTKQPTCEVAGEKLLTCTVCGQTKTEAIPALGHKWDAGVVIKPATTTETGERLYTCQNDKTHTKTEKIPVITLANNTLCAIGPMLRDQRYYSAWYMFTPIDVSKDGRQTFDLIASKAHVVGTLTVEVRNGNMTVDYKVTGNTLKVTLEAFTVAGSMNEITRYEPEDLVYSGFRVRTPINLQETFGDDRNLILYFCSRCDYTVNQRWADFSEKSASYRSTVSQMLSLMDRDY